MISTIRQQPNATRRLVRDVHRVAATAILHWAIYETTQVASWGFSTIWWSMLPPKTQRFGACDVSWEEIGPGEIYISSVGDSYEERMHAQANVRKQFEEHDYEEIARSASQHLGSVQRLASWPDIQAKATRLIQQGKVKITGNAQDIVTGVVEGDHGTYNTEIQRQDPESQSISMWSCECAWDQFAWQRTRQWKRLEGRVCSHVLATYWQALSMPFDEDIGPGSEEPQAPEGGEGGAVPPGQSEQPAPTPQPSPFAQVPGGGTGMVPPAGTPGPQKPGMPNQQAPTPEPAGGVPGQAPEPRSLIPQYPQDPALQPAINPVSVPGQKPQTPLNPIQNPGGTFSHVRESAGSFTNGDMVQLKQEDYGQTVGLGAGDTKLIPANSLGEVLGTDPLGLVNVYFAGPQAQAGRMEPHGVVCWVWPQDIIPRPDVRAPGPAIRRR